MAKQHEVHPIWDAVERGDEKEVMRLFVESRFPDCRIRLTGHARQLRTPGELYPCAWCGSYDLEFKFFIPSSFPPVEPMPYPPIWAVRCKECNTLQYGKLVLLEEESDARPTAPADS